MATAAGPAQPQPWRAVRDGVHVTVRVTPKASRTKIDGLTTLATGATAIKIQVHAPPEGGKANAAVLRLLAKSWRIPKTALSVQSGTASRTKTARIAGSPADLIASLAAWLDNVGAEGENPAK